MSRTAETKGKVWLAGAGPGDAGLLTVKARELIDRADVIVYDALVSTEIISQVPRTGRLVHVGKRSGHHPVPQEEINQILLAEAKKGNRVLRLKGGDPFVFGRGGEELELLAEAGIPFEVVPGVTSAAAVPAYAGIPVTHREYASSFHIITGHPRQDGSSRINYPALVSMDATLVFLMGVAAMEEICCGLLAAGMDAGMPAAILEKGTMSMQRQVISTIGRLGEDAVKAGIGTPAIILVGKVCKLGEVFHWAQDRTLGGRQILITRPRESSSRLARQLRELGAQVIELPAIATKPIEPGGLLEKALADFAQRGEESWLVFTSPVGVKVFFEQLMQLQMDIRALIKRQADVRFAAIGSATAGELRKHGICTDLVPDIFSAADLGKKLAEKAKPGSQITIMRAKEGSEELIPPLLAAGLMVEDIAAYETVYETHCQVRDQITDIYQHGEINAVTFTSASTVKGVVGAMGDIDYSNVTAVCIGEQTAAAAREYHMPVVVADEASINSMVDKIVELYGK